MKNKILSVILITIILSTIIPTVSFAYGNTYYATNQRYDVSTSPAGYGDIIIVSGNVTLTGTNNKGIMIRCTTSCQLTLENLTVSLQESNIWDMCALEFYDSTNSTLTLAGNNVIKSGVNEPGIKVPSSATLTIDGDGSLYVKGGEYAAGIGSDSRGHSSGTVIITSGNITAEGGNYGGAGIGGGRQGSNGTVRISGGTVNANGGYLGAGIGGGGAYDADFLTGNGGTIEISEGTVTAKGVMGAGIGGGGDSANTPTALGGNGGTINISGGTVDAIGYRGGAGIGSGKLGGSACVINISGGIVRAKSNYTPYVDPDIYAAGIGGGHASAVVKVNITGGEVYAERSEPYGTSYACSQDIGSGKNATGGTVSISNTAAVFLKNDLCENLSTSHTHVWGQTISSNSAYGYTNFPSDWSGTAYGYVVRYRVSFNGKGNDGGSLPSTRYYYLSDADKKIPEPTAPNVPTKTGYTLSGWYDNWSCSGSAWDFANDEVSRSMTLYTKWAPINYTIAYNNLSGAANPNPTSYNIESNIILSPLSRTGYVFDGWYDNAELSGSPITQIPTGSTGNRQYWAKWSTQDYTITYNNINGATNPNPTSYNIEDADITLSPLSQTGYVFDGWYDNAELSGSAATLIPSGSTEDKQYWAKWIAQEYIITFYGNGNTGGLMSSQLITFSDTTALNTIGFEKKGYRFVGWSYTPNGTILYRDNDIFTMSLEGLDLYAQWEKVIVKNPETGDNDFATGVFMVGVAILLILAISLTIKFKLAKSLKLVS